MKSFTEMKPENAIAPRPIIRRAGRQRWHLARVINGKVTHRGYASSYCGQAFRPMEQRQAYNAEQITCSDCLAAAITERSKA